MPQENPDFVVAVSQETHQRLLRLLGSLAERLGRLPDVDGPRYADDRDLIGAALAVTERRPAIFDAVATEVRRAALRRGARGELLAVCDELDGVVPRLDAPQLRGAVAQVARDLRESAVSIAVRDEPVRTAGRLRAEAQRLAELAQGAGPWSQSLRDLAESVDDLQDALHPIEPGT
ncbi:hypothetical protein LQ327_20855 [Actinomycetospora endophytica]|uniref:Uncharacterized protein n=1 Tax=Actinomycetospora endophytica TaxID=2291215 RepID=A0ABS8PC50_9PSEU|nr:hypothetical protein [Actinomycetospora endophytica]MCD2195826.1 hypothetical protein [Actinomycetospora endophytica]